MLHSSGNLPSMFSFPRWPMYFTGFFALNIKCFICTARAPVFGRHQFFGTSEHYGKAHGSLLSGWMNYNYTARCLCPTSSNILILPSQFWQIRFESCWLHCSKCWILVFLRYLNCHTLVYFIFTEKYPMLALKHIIFPGAVGVRSGHVCMHHSISCGC